MERYVHHSRSMPGQLTLGFREQMNQITSFADSSNVYGSDLCEMRELREFHGGRLNSTKQGRDSIHLNNITKILTKNITNFLSKSYN